MSLCPQGAGGDVRMSKTEQNTEQNKFQKSVNGSMKTNNERLKWNSNKNEKKESKTKTTVVIMKKGKSQKRQNQNQKIRKKKQKGKKKLDIMWWTI